MTDDSYHMPICIGIGIGISIGKIFSSVLGIKSIGKSGIGSPLVYIIVSIKQYYKYKKPDVRWPVADVYMV